jgi:hypothetical protein
MKKKREISRKIKCRRKRREIKKKKQLRKKARDVGTLPSHVQFWNTCDGHLESHIHVVVSGCYIA